MKVLVGTTKTQGMRPGDFCFADGQLVTVDEACVRDRKDPDGGCGCGRSFTGFDTHQGTTTAIVEDRDMTQQEFEEALRVSLLQAWGDVLVPEAIPHIAGGLLEMAGHFPVGAVIERRLDKVRQR